MNLLEIKDLRVEIDGKEILKGLDLTVKPGEVHAIMGPNGSGKSTLAYVLAGKEDYRPTAGEVRFNGRDLFEMEPDERAATGLFLAFQYPLEIPGVATMTFLRTALNAQRKKRGQKELSTPDFIKKVRDTAGKLGIDATVKIGAETTRQWGRPLAMSADVVDRIERRFGHLLAGRGGLVARERARTGYGARPHR